MSISNLKDSGGGLGVECCVLKLVPCRGAPSLVLSYKWIPVFAGLGAKPAKYG